MAQSMLEMYPEEFTNLDKAWRELGKSFLSKPSLDKVKNVLEAEAVVYRISNGRPDPEINAFVALDTPTKIQAATAWLQKQRAMISVAIENTAKASHLQQSDHDQQRKFKARLQAINNAERVLSKRLHLATPTVI